jgi:hypothetical protein
MGFAGRQRSASLPLSKGQGIAQTVDNAHKWTGSSDAAHADGSKSNAYIGFSYITSGARYRRTAASHNDDIEQEHAADGTRDIRRTACATSLRAYNAEPARTTQPAHRSGPCGPAVVVLQARVMAGVSANEGVERTWWVRRACMPSMAAAQSPGYLSALRLTFIMLLFTSQNMRA